jgi:ribonuclease P protein component
MAAVPNALSHNRYGFIASRHLGGAVVRNRVRRILREAVRQLAPHLKIGFDFTLIARNEIVDQPYSKVCNVLEELFKRANLWQEDAQP